ncbi:LOW QUALITY PROTEIN: hypothetical protein KIPB_000307 [Kipferlia bialata]|uniref:Uncharacterized protein n=1 Tax=Kipferlia bialata TaxID=797122 RepID=A0A9K3CN75_9EUKA|nr:LOW QUALITY PROTEIN: hypothetical protein KIPB_000307 [Kipferlia bialata]
MTRPSSQIRGAVVRAGTADVTNDVIVASSVYPIQAYGPFQDSGTTPSLYAKIRIDNIGSTTARVMITSTSYVIDTFDDGASGNEPHMDAAVYSSGALKCYGSQPCANNNSFTSVWQNGDIVEMEYAFDTTGIVTFTLWRANATSGEWEAESTGTYQVTEVLPQLVVGCTAGEFTRLA